LDPSLEGLVNAMAGSSGELADSLQKGESLPPLGLRRAARLPVTAALYSSLKRPVVLITDRADHVLAMAEELGLWAPQAPRYIFPEPNPLFYENASWGDATRRDRLMALTRLAGYHIPGAAPQEGEPVIIAPARAVMTRTMPRRDFLKATRSLKRGQVVQPDELARSWVALGYEVVNTVIAAGQFARRGGILDVWPPAEPYPARIEFFGDEIESLRRFNPSTQRTLKPGVDAAAVPERLLISPAREYLLPAGYVSPLTPTETQGQEPANEFHIPLLHATHASLLDYLPRQALVLVDDWELLQDSIGEIEEQAVGLRQDYINDGTLPEDFPIPYLTWAEVQDSLSMHQVLELGPSSSIEGSSLAGYFTPGPRFGGRLKPAMDYVLERYAAGDRLVIVSRQFARLQELWTEARPEALESAGDGQAPNPLFLEGSLSEGWTFTPVDGIPRHLLTDGEIFGFRRPEPRQRARAVAEEPEAAYADLQPGDWVVHVDHGVGHFVGLVSRSVDESEREYLCVEYAENDQLFVPVYQADRLTRYVGPENREPTPTRLGSPEWKNAKGRAQEAVQEVAQDLLELYARRQLIQGTSFGSDTPWQQELEASFPYMETEDQLRVITEVKRDMESLRPMDRLICGDVGYGKTEVALRAAFKAVMDGKQVAVLVPTTVLAQQHYNTFRERLSPFSVEVEMLSRFRNPHQQREILDRLVKGGVDILIGTHRLIQEDVKFKDMGLLIIDEEQRFGVTHKEYLKRMRTEVDVLTLTATPIPRTLYMALTGVRDISTINTPPEERLPIVTHVGPYSPRLARQAILRELERGGQVFFVHNRVQTIGAMRAHLENLVPEARLTVAHGQMPENELSERMERFIAGDVDILLSTSIIESGLDIPNANTLIVDRADTFGLAQLYQLRGRVGRGAQRAYAYFFRHGKRLPTLDGRQRLETIAENTQLGAGFSIAMRDLEIRGAGDILGMRQSGHIAAVGFHLYTRLLADAVRRLRRAARSGLAGGPIPVEDERQEALLESVDPQRPLVSVDLPLSIHIPGDYVPDKTMRLRLYRRIADLQSLQDVEAMEGEFSDRFGPLPDAVRNLLYQMKVKLLAEKASVVSVSGEGGQIVLRFPPLPEGVAQRDLPTLGPDVRTGKNALWMQSSHPEWQDKLVDVLESLVEKRTL
jgi:transcription-repair coupling factor (superfamily II helicase)